MATKQQYRQALAKQLYRQHPQWQTISWQRLSMDAKENLFEEADSYANAENNGKEGL